MGEGAGGRGSKEDVEGWGAQGHQPSVTVESYFFLRSSAVDSELNTERTLQSLRTQSAWRRAAEQTQPWPGGVGGHTRQETVDKSIKNRETV